MAFWRRLDWNAIVMLSFGTLFLVSGILALVLFPGTTYHTTLEAADTGTDVDGTGYGTYQFEALSDRGKQVFLTARNESDNTVTVSERARAPLEFSYPSDTTTPQYVAYEGRYYLVSTMASGCLGPCAVARVLLGTVALPGLGCLWYGRRRLIGQ